MSSRPTAEAWTYEGGAPGLGVSGSGDMLAGIVGGLLARGADPLTPCCGPCWLHGEAGAALREKVGPIGFLAREIPDEIPGATCRAMLLRAGSRSSSSPISRTTWSTLVEPAVPNGMPAMIITRSPPSASWWRSAMRLALLDHLLEARDVARVDRVDAPQQAQPPRRVDCDALIASIGTGGRSRAIRRAVEPELRVARPSPVAEIVLAICARRAGERVGGRRLEPRLR